MSVVYARREPAAPFQHTEQMHRQRGVRVKERSDLAVVALGVRLIPATFENALCASLVLKFSVK